jgi:hypothetical protein
LKTQYLKIKGINKRYVQKNKALVRNKAKIEKQNEHLRRKVRLFQCHKDRLSKQKKLYQLRWEQEHHKNQELKKLYEDQQSIIEHYQQYFARTSSIKR